MPDRVRIELFEAEDVNELVYAYTARRQRSTANCHIDAEDLVNAIGEIYEAALIRMRRAALT